LGPGDELLGGDHLGRHGGIDALLAVALPLGDPHDGGLLYSLGSFALMNLTTLSRYSFGMYGAAMAVRCDLPGRMTLVKSFSSRFRGWVFAFGRSNSPLMASTGKVIFVRSSLGPAGLAVTGRGGRGGAEEAASFSASSRLLPRSIARRMRSSRLASSSWGSRPSLSAGPFVFPSGST